MSGSSKPTGPDPSPETVAAVREKARDGYITCAVLRRTAEELDVPYREAGAAADAQDIRIRSCDLGCF
jgi:LAO/AO transport system kinase